MGKPVIISVILVGLAASQLTAAGTKCQTHNGGSGSCLFLENCNSLQEIMTALSPLERVTKLYQIRSQCGYDNYRVLICCPDSDRTSYRNKKRELSGDAPNCKSLNGENGSCLFLENCMGLYNDMKALSPIDRVAKLYQTRSQCGYKNTRPLICCPDSDSTFLKTLPAPVTPAPTQATLPPTEATTAMTHATPVAPLPFNLPLTLPQLKLQCSYSQSNDPQTDANGVKIISQSYVFTSQSGSGSDVQTDMKCGNESKALLGLRIIAVTQGKRKMERLFEINCYLGACIYSLTDFIVDGCFYAIKELVKFGVVLALVYMFALCIFYMWDHNIPFPTPIQIFETLTSGPTIFPPTPTVFSPRQSVNIPSATAPTKPYPNVIEIPEKGVSDEIHRFSKISADSASSAGQNISQFVENKSEAVNNEEAAKDKEEEGNLKRRRSSLSMEIVNF